MTHHDTHCDCPDLTAGGICPEARGHFEDEAIAMYSTPDCLACGEFPRWQCIATGGRHITGPAVR